MRRDVSYLEDIYNAATDAVEFVSGISFDTFASDNLMRRGVVNCLHEIGEASSKLSKQFKRSHPLIPWDELISHRNELAHEYFRTDYGQVWHVVKTILPGLIECIEPMIPKDDEL